MKRTAAATAAQSNGATSPSASSTPLTQAAIDAKRAQLTAELRKLDEDAKAIVTRNARVDTTVKSFHAQMTSILGPVTPQVIMETALQRMVAAVVKVVAPRSHHAKARKSSKAKSPVKLSPERNEQLRVELTAWQASVNAGMPVNESASQMAKRYDISEPTLTARKKLWGLTDPEKRMVPIIADRAAATA